MAKSRLLLAKSRLLVLPWFPGIPGNTGNTGNTGNGLQPDPIGELNRTECFLPEWQKARYPVYSRVFPCIPRVPVSKARRAVFRPKAGSFWPKAGFFSAKSRLFWPEKPAFGLNTALRASRKETPPTGSEAKRSEAKRSVAELRFASLRFALLLIQKQ